MKYTSSMEKSKGDVVNHGRPLPAKRIIMMALCLVSMCSVVKVSKATGLIVSQIWRGHGTPPSF